MPISVTDNWGEKPLSGPLPAVDGTAALINRDAEQQLESFRVADHKARAAAAHVTCWELTGKYFGDKSSKDDAEHAVIAMHDAGYIDKDTRDNVITSFRLKPAPRSLAERRAEIESRLDKKDSAFTMSAETFKKLWDSI